MKYLLLNRHAKSPWGNLNVSDHDRELSKQGFLEAKRMGERFLIRRMKFDSMITSSALRALTTCQSIALELNFNIENIKIDKNIYGATDQQLKRIICKIDNNINRLAIFGHNPTLHMLSEDIYGKVIESFPTCAAIFVKFETNQWGDCFKCDREVIFFDWPENE